MNRAFIVFCTALATMLVASVVPAAEEKKADDSSARPRDLEGRSALFDKLDANHDGQIAADDVPEESRRLFERLLRRGDRNDDGKLSREEFFAAMEEGPGRPADRGPGAGPDGASPGQKAGGPGTGPFAGGAGPFMGIAVFRALDANGDGKLDAKEIAAAADVLKKMANSSGEITREELLKSLPAEMAAGAKGGPGSQAIPPGAKGGGLAGMNPEVAMKRILEQFDKNDDGKLQKDELPRPLQQRFDELDTNKDGALDQSELKEILPRLVRRMQQERAAPGGKGKKSENN